MLWYITSYGVKHAEHRLEGIGNAALNPRPAFEEIYLTLLDIEQETFDVEGGHGGPFWAKDTLQHMVRKARAGQSLMVGQMTGDMMRSLTTYRHPQQNIRIEKTKIVFGSKLKYSRWFNAGWKQPIKPFSAGRRVVRYNRVSPRPLLRITESEAASFGREIMRHLLRDRVPGTIE